jgi:hypothetical protein
LAVRPQSLRLGVAPSPYTPLSGQHRAGFAWHDSLPGWRRLRARDLAPRVPPSLSPGLLPGAVTRGTGILTRCPSPTALALGLGPPHPQLISMAAEPSGIRWGGFAPPSRYSCRHSHSPPLHPRSRASFSADGDAPLPWQSVSTIRGFGHGLEPRWIVGAAAQSTSELLRTLSRMAASKPTSWLSARRDHLAH